MTMFDKVKKIFAKNEILINELDFYKVNICGKRYDVTESGDRIPLSDDFWKQIYDKLKRINKSNSVILQIKNYDCFEEPMKYDESEYYGIRTKIPVVYTVTPKTHKIKLIIDGRNI